MPQQPPTTLKSNSRCMAAMRPARSSGSPKAALQQKTAADLRVAEAVARLAAWDQSTPTGIRQGYDGSDAPGALREPSAEEIRHSIAATIYSVWRNQFLNNTVVAFESFLPARR